MPPRDQELPEGTDQIINGAMETGAGTGASTGSSGTGGIGTGGLGASSGTGGFGGTGTGGTTPGGTADFAGSTGTGTGGGSSSGFIGASGGSGDDTGGLAGGGSGGSDFGGGSAGLATSGGAGGGLSGGSDFGGGSGGGSGDSGGSGDFGGGGTGGGNDSSGGGGQLQGSVQALKQQATEKVRSYAEDGKSRATSALDDLAQLVQETAQSIDDRLGPQYGDYARRAAGTVTDLSERLRSKEVDELFDDAREIVRKSPGVAIGAAAVVGFALVRLIKSGMPDQSAEVEFQPDAQLTAGGTGSTGSSPTGTTGTSPAGTTKVDSQAPHVAPTTGA